MKILLTTIYGFFVLAACGQEASFQDNASLLQQAENEENPPSEDLEKKDPDLLSHISDLAEGAGDGVEIEVGNGEGIKDIIITAEKLAELCQNQEKKLLTQQIVFDEPEQTCQWGTDDKPVNGNIGILDGRVGARYRQDQTLNLPDNALLCDMNMDFVSDNPNGQDMYYDDEIYITFNDVILAGSQSYDAYFEKNSDGFLIYDWDKIVGQKYGQDLFEPYCVGEALGMGTCMIPPTQTQGVIKMDFNDEIIKKIAVSTGLNIDKDGVKSEEIKSNFELSFITTGDNDTKVDCMHSRFEFEISAEYITLDK